MDKSTPHGGIHIFSDPETTRVERPAPEGAHESVQLPFRLLLAADLAPHRNPAWEHGSEVVRVDRHSYGDLLERLAPRLELEVPNRLSPRPKRLEVSLTFTSLSDFRPEGIAQQVPALHALLKARSLVQQVERGEVNADAFRERLKAISLDQRWAERLDQILAPPAASEPGHTAPSSSRKEDDALGRLLGMVDTGDGERAEADEPGTEQDAGLMGALLDAAGSSPGSPARRAADDTNGVLKDLDAAVTAQLNAIFNHEATRRLEAAWRGVKFLVDRIDLRAGVRLDVLPVTREALDEALYHQVLLPEHKAGQGHTSVSAIALDFPFSNNARDVQLLNELAETAASLQVPLIGSVAPSFFGAETHAGLARLPLLWQHLERPEYTKWRRLRERPEAEYLALVLPAFLLRYPYGVDRPAEDLSFQEEGCLWGSGALVAALAAADSFVHTGSPSHVRGRKVEDLPLWQSAQGPAPLAAVFPTEKQRELADAGFVVLSVQRDAVILTHAPMIKRTAMMDDAEATREARMHAALPCRLFVARAAHLLLLLEHDVEGGMPVDEARTLIADRFRRWLGSSGEEAKEAVQVEHIAEAQTPDYDVLAVRLQPPGHVLEDTVRLVLAARLPRHARQTDDERTSV